jgi:hypothetical protein
MASAKINNFMNRKKAFFVLVAGLLFFAGTNNVFAANACKSNVTAGNWSASSTWTACGGGIPTSADSVEILTGHIIAVDTAAVASATTIDANAAVGGNGILINSGQSLNVTNAVILSIPTASTTVLAVGAGSLTAGSIAIPGGAANRFATVSVSTGNVTVSGNITFSGTAARAIYTSTGASMTNIGGNFGAGGTLTTSGTGTFNFNGSGAQVIGAYATYNNVQINNTTGGVTFGGTTTIGGTLLINNGTLDIGGITVTVNGATTVNSTMRMSATGGAKNFASITIANGGILNFTANETLTESGNLAIHSGGIMSFTAAGVMALAGNLTIDGTGAITGTPGKWTFSKVGGGSISGTSTSTQTLAAVTFTTNYSNSLNLAATGVTTLNTPVVVTNTGTYTCSGAGNFGGSTGTFTQGVNGILNFNAGSGNGTVTLNASANPNEVHFTSTSGAQTINSATYYDLFIDKAGQTGTLGGAITVNNNLTVSGGTLADGGFQITGNATGKLSIASTSVLVLGSAGTATTFPTLFTNANISLPSGSIVSYNAGVAQNISNIPTYDKLTLAAAAGTVTKTVTASTTVNNTLTVGAHDVLSDGGYVITLKGNSVMTGSATSTGVGEILFTGGSAAHILSGTSGLYGNIEFNDGNGVTQSGPVGIAGTFIVANGTWDTNGQVLNVTGATSISGILAMDGALNVKTFGDITINNGGTIAYTTAQGVRMNGNLTINGSGAVTGTTGVWTFQRAGGGTIGGTAPSITISGPATFGTAYSLPTIFTVNSMIVSSTITETNVGTTTIIGVLSGAGTFAQSANTVLYLGGTPTITTLSASASPNDVHYNSAGTESVKTADYYNLFLDGGTTKTMTGTSVAPTNILGNFVVTSNEVNFLTSFVNITGTSDIYGEVFDQNNTGLITFGGLLTMHAGSSWAGISAEACNFTFHNGMRYDGGAFSPGNGNFTFDTNNQSITGSSSVTIGHLVVNSIQLTNTNASSVTISGVTSPSLSGTGEFIQDANAVLNITGTSAITTLTASSIGNTVNYNGTAEQTVHAGTYQTLNVSGNTNGNVDIVTDTTADTNLTLGSTILATASNKMIMGPGATVSRTTGFINGNLQKNYSATQLSHTFQVGSGIIYAPVQLVFNAVTTPGNVLVNTTPGYEPNFATSHLLSSSSVERYYTVNNGGVGFDTYNATFTFDPTDVDASATTANFLLGEFSSGTWSRPTLGTVTSTSISATGLTSFGDFQIGDARVATTTLVSTTHANGTFGTGEIIDITVQYSDVVTVAGGVPSIALNSGGNAFYISGSGTDTLTFRYVVLAGENSAGLDYTSTGALSLNGATIEDSIGGNTDNTLPSVGVFAGAHAIVINTTIPVLNSISPTSTTASSGDFTLTVSGANFVGSSTVQWNGSNRSTTFVSSSTITALIANSDILTVGTSSVAVVNSAPGGGTSNSQTFTINNPVPTVVSISPASTAVGGTNFILTVSGANFVGSSIVQWNGSNRITTFVSSTQLTASISSSDLMVANTFPITVVNPAPDGGISNVQTFTVITPNAYTAWIDHGVNYTAPAGNAYYPSVIYDPSGFGTGTPQYAMWYSDGNGSVYLVTSSDGTTWGIPTTMAGLTNAHHAQVLYDVNCFGALPCNATTIKYRMWFWDMGANLYSISSMATAVSADGINWINKTAVTQNPAAKLVQDPDSGTGWNRGTYGPVNLFYQPSATNTGTEPWNYSYVMYYDGTDGSHEYTGLAYSTDGLSWSAYTANPVLNGSSVGAWDCYSSVYGTIHKDSAGFHYFYSGKGQADSNGNCIDPASNNFDGIGYASSLDGKTWTKDTTPIFQISDGVSYRSGRIYTPSVVNDGSDILRMYFSVTDSSGTPKKIGYATLTDPAAIHAVKFIFANVSPSSVVGNGATFNVEAVNSSGTVDTSFEQGVTLTVGGSSSGGGLVTIVNGVGTSTVNDDVAQTVLLGLEDSQSTGLNVSSTANVAFTPGSVAQFVLNHPGNMNANTRLGYTVGRQDQFGNFVSSSGTLAYLYSNSTSTNAAFWNAPAGGSIVTSTLISDGSTSTAFWYYDDTSGSRTVTVSDNPSAPDGFAGIIDASDTFAVAPGAVKFIFANVPTNTTAGSAVTVNIYAVDSSNNIYPLFGGGITVTTLGSATGGGLVNIVSGVGTTTITDLIAETVTLGFSDTQNTGLGVGATSPIIFNPTPVIPVTPASSGGGASPTQVAPGIKPSITMTLSGMAYPGASVMVIRKDLGLTAVPTTQAIPVATDGSFLIELNNVVRLTGQTYLLSFTDKNGLIAQTKAYNVPAQDKLVYGNILAAPTLGFENSSVVAKGAPLVVMGYATPKATVELFVDGNAAGTILVNDPSGKYRSALATDNLSSGRHSVWAIQKYAESAVEILGYANSFSQNELFVDDSTSGALITKNASGTYAIFVPAITDGTIKVRPVTVSSMYTKQAESDFSNQQSFTISPLADPKLDLNGDGVIDIRDMSIFLSYLKNLTANLVNFHVVDPTIVRVLDFNGDGVVDGNDLKILSAAVARP